jgi:hypothetical protein
MIIKSLLVAISFCTLFVGRPYTFARSWMEVPGPAATTDDSTIYSMVALSGTDVWAVGDFAGTPLIEHWDGANWVVVPNPGVHLGYLSGVAARSPNNVWAVGTTGQRRTLVEHWDGTEWIVVPSPNVGTTDNQLDGVEVVSRDDAWAVGTSGLGIGSAYILMHWNGHSWSLVNGPPVSGSWLTSIKAFASDDVWAVGTKDYDGTRSFTFTLHWDGSAWSEIPSPNVQMLNSLDGVDGTAPNDVWAVGTSTSSPNFIIHTMAMHWNGTAWSLVPTPVTQFSEWFSAVKAFSPTNVCAVGTSAGAPFSERWDGTQWRILPIPPTDPGGLLLTISGRDGAVWAGGNQNSSGQTTDELFLVVTP